MKEKSWIEINSTALEHNINALKGLLSPEARFCAIIKANAYGHDLKTVAKLLSFFGISYFGVDSCEEARIVRISVPSAEIFILGYTPIEKYEDVVNGGFIQNVYHEDSIEQLSAIALKLRKKARINLKIETGTNRQGIGQSQLYSMLRTIKQFDREIEFVGISSHLADAEVPDSTMTKYQIEIFNNILKEVSESGIVPNYRHIACSAVAILNPETHFDMVRIGISLYGLWSSSEVRKMNNIKQNAIDLKPVLSWKTQIAQVKDIQKGSSIGYGMKFRADKVMRIAVLPVGYYDGYKRSISKKGEVLVNGQVCKIVGTICMNMMMIDVSNLPNVKVGDIVTLIGKDGMHNISADNLSEWSGTINYEILASLGSHIPRITV